jgi:hypothetical protein
VDEILEQMGYGVLEESGDEVVGIVGERAPPFL